MTCGLAQLLNKIFIAEENPPLKEIAARIDMNYHTLYSRVDGTVAVRPQEVKHLLLATGDIRIAQWLLEGTPFMAVERPDADIESGKGEGIRRLHKSATGAVIEVVELMSEIEDAISDNKIDHIDLAEIEQALTDAEEALGSLRAHIEARKKHPS
jgi:hypothetical protein